MAIETSYCDCRSSKGAIDMLRVGEKASTIACFCCFFTLSVRALIYSGFTLSISVYGSSPMSTSVAFVIDA